MSKGVKNNIFWVLSILFFSMPFALYFMNQKAPKVRTMPTIASQSHRPVIGIEIHLTGAINEPGVYKVAVGTKLHELLSHITLWPNATLDNLNLAQTLRDGQKVSIKSKSNETHAIININLASYKELLALPGIGPATAKKIVDQRDNRGVIKNKDELIQIIGPSKVKKMGTIVF